MRLLAATAFALLATATAFADPAVPTVDKIEAKLLLTTTGALSGNVAAPSGVTLWNTIIGEGGAGPANDVLVIVSVKADPNYYIEAPLDIAITGADGKPVASRKIEGILVGDSGVSSQGVYLQDATCSALTVKATLGASTVTTEVPFACGE